MSYREVAEKILDDLENSSAPVIIDQCQRDKYIHSIVKSLMTAIGE